MAEIIPFRFSRCVGRLRRTARATVDMSRPAAAKHIDFQLRRLEEALLSHGVAPEAVDAELRSYRAALDAHIWRIVMTGEGTNGGDAA